MGGLVGGEEEGGHGVVLVGEARLRVGQLQGGVLLLPGDAHPPAGGHHHRLDHVDLVPRDVGGSSERLEGRSLELEGYCTSSIDKHVKPASGSSQGETIVGRSSTPVDTHTNSDDSLERKKGSSNEFDEDKQE